MFSKMLGHFRKLDFRLKIALVPSELVLGLEELQGLSLKTLHMYVVSFFSVSSCRSLKKNNSLVKGFKLSMIRS